VKQQAGAFLEKAGELIDQANTMLSAALTDAAGRTAHPADPHLRKCVFAVSSAKPTAGDEIWKPSSARRGRICDIIRSMNGEFS
jgi:hypothetical protein